jgi:uncharacterized small protein (DUF1192 family)
VNQADIDLLERMTAQEDRIRTLQAEVERLSVDNYYLRQEIDRIRKKGDER